MTSWDLIYRTYLVSTALQFLIWPVIWKFFRKMVDGGWAMGRVLVMVVVSLVIWVLGNLGIGVNSDVGVLTILLMILLGGLMVLKKEIGGGKKKMKKEVWKFFREKWKFILMEEVLFLVGFFGLATVRAYAPRVLGLEKFMDFGFIKQYLIAERLPANDMWFAGESINYYSFGHLMTSVMVRIWGTGLGVGYNLMLAWILGVSLMLSFSIVVNASKTLIEGKLKKMAGDWKLIVGGVLGSLLVCLGGNTHTLWYFIKNKNLDGYWYADATRFIENTIHEFPGYSFVVSDLHAHLLGLPVVLVFLLIMIGWMERKESEVGKKKKRKMVGIEEVLLGTLLGVMMMTNTWDVAVYGMMLGFLCLFLWIFRKVRLGRLFVSGITVLGIGIVVSVQWWINFDSIPQGILATTERSPLWQLGVLWGGLLLTTLMAVVSNFRWKKKGKKKRIRMENLWVVAVAISVVLLIVIPEFLYVKDIYPSHQRANTMFKLTYQAFILMGLLLGWLVNRLLVGMKGEKRWWRVVVMMVVLTLFGFEILFGYKAFSSYYGRFKVYKGIDGLGWFRNEEVDKWGVVQFLEENRDGKNMVEGVGDSYSEMNSVSAFSGTPTVVGWRVHEWLWRGEYDKMGERDIEVREIYEFRDLEYVKNLLKIYDVGWILVGPDERINYEINEVELMKLGKIVWRGGENYLIKVTDDEIGDL